MKILQYLFKQKLSLMIMISIGSVMAGLSASGLVVVISQSLETIEGGVQPMLPVMFIALCAVHVLTKSASEVALVKKTQSIVRQLRLQLSREIISTPQNKLQKIGNEGLMMILTRDIETLAMGFQVLPALISSIVVILACNVYTLMLSWQIFTIFMIAMIICMGGYQIAEKTPVKQLFRARNESDNLFKLFANLVSGSRELQLNRERADTYIDNVLSNRSNTVSSLFVKAMSRYSWTRNVGNLLFYQSIAFVLFVLPFLSSVELPAIVSSTVVMMFAIKPLGELMTYIPILRQAGISLKKIEELEGELIVEQGRIEEDPFGNQINSLSFDNVTFSYDSQDEESFKLGPISLKVVPGETLFIIGGNGSGKSSLAMLLLSLFRINTGEIKLNGVSLSSSNLEYYRQRFSAILADGHLFEQLPTMDSEMLDRAMGYIDALGLSSKVSIVDGEFSTIKLSTGQRKRLLLVSSYIEDRSVYIFDEWAADQDPEFKKVFYTKILPDLKNRGKTTIVITHDDAFFKYSDRIIKLQDGRLSSTSSTDYEDRVEAFSGSEAEAIC